MYRADQFSGGAIAPWLAFIRPIKGSIADRRISAWIGEKKQKNIQGQRRRATWILVGPELECASRSLSA
jgi:hypothetical protein